MFKFSLDKSSKKFICPSCSRKTFVKFMDSEQNIYVDGDYGRCDRETNCGYLLFPRQCSTISSIAKPIVKFTASTLNNDLIIQSGKSFTHNNLIKFLKKYFSTEEIDTVIQKYAIGTSAHWKGATVFWQINSQNQIMTGKVMLFDAGTGKRIKVPYNHIQWVHKLLKLKDFVLQQCLFGLHLINETTKKGVAIVEAEKTAVIMRLFLPEYIWMATGGKKLFNKKMLLPIKDYTILAYPDKSEFDDWNKIALELQKEGFKISCSQFIENMDVSAGTDLADVYFEILKNNCSIPTQTKQSKAEIEVQRLARINPEILNLIRTFELLDDDHNEIVNTDFES